MKIKFFENEEDCGYICTEKIDGQTFEMKFSQYGENDKGTILYWWVEMCLYSKRKHKDRVMNNAESTGKNPFKTISVAIKAFNYIEDKIYFDFPDINNAIIVQGSDSKRKRVYEKYLSRKDYKPNVFDGKKCLMKIIERKEDEDDSCDW